MSGQVYRLAGFRLDSRELLLSVRGTAGRGPERRVAFLRVLPEDPEGVDRALASADLVVAAMGYAPRLLTVLDPQGAEVPLAGSERGRAAVDDRCRVLDREGRPVPGLHGLGLGMGFVPTGRFGGEPSFRGQANGLWLWQNDVGSMVADALVGEGAPTDASLDRALEAAGD